MSRLMSGRSLVIKKRYREVDLVRDGYRRDTSKIRGSHSSPLNSIDDVNIDLNGRVTLWRNVSLLVTLMWLGR